MADMFQHDFAETMRERRWKEEGVFAEAKNNHGLSRAKYRGRKKVQIQAFMTAIIQNLKRLLQCIKKGIKRIPKLNENASDEINQQISKFPFSDIKITDLSSSRSSHYPLAIFFTLKLYFFNTPDRFMGLFSLSIGG